MIKQSRLNIEKKILAYNDGEAALNRKWLKERSIIALNLISSPGSGKTKLLERTLDMITNNITCAVITSDIKTDNDAKRLAGKGAVIRHIETNSSCHLDAKRIKKILPAVGLVMRW